MAYFSNGTEGMDYESRYCDNCVNFRGDKVTGEKSCPIWDLHYEYNYDQNRTTERGQVIGDILATLIPMQKDKPWADQCSMFIRHGAEVATAERDYLEGLRFGGKSPVELMTQK